MTSSDGEVGKVPLLHLVDHDPLHILLTIFGLFTLVFAVLGRLLKETLWLTEPLLAFAVGIVFAAGGVGWAHLDLLHNLEQRAIVLELTRVTIVIQVVASAMELPVGLVRRQWWALFLLLVPVLVTTWGISTLLVWGIMRLPILESVLVGACVTPTDPVLAHAIVKGAFAETLLPARLRDVVSAESAANDGLAYPFVALPILLLSEGAIAWTAARYVVSIWLWEVAFGVVIGMVIGLLAAIVLDWSVNRHFMEHDSLLAFAIILSLTSLGVGRLLHVDEILTAFAAGMVFRDYVKADERFAEMQIQETADLLTGNLFFLVFGASVPYEFWRGSPFTWWQLVLVAFAVHLFKRTPVILAVYKFMPKGIKTWQEALHTGWFGPVGVAAFFYAITVLNTVGGEVGERTYILVTWLAVASIVLHGITGVPVTRWLAPGMVRDEAVDMEPPPQANDFKVPEPKADASEGPAALKAEVNWLTRRMRSIGHGFAAALKRALPVQFVKAAFSGSLPSVAAAATAGINPKKFEPRRREQLLRNSVASQAEVATIGTARRASMSRMAADLPAYARPNTGSPRLHTPGRIAWANAAFDEGRGADGVAGDKPPLPAEIEKTKIAESQELSDGGVDSTELAEAGLRRMVAAGPGVARTDSLTSPTISSIASSTSYRSSSNVITSGKAPQW